MPLSIEQIKDAVGKKFLGWIVDAGGGTNVAAAPKGVNLTTQNGDQVADLAVSLDGEKVILGPGSDVIGKVVPTDASGNVATDDAPVSGPLYSIAGTYQASPDEIDSGDVGRVRVTRRRALITAADYKLIALTAANPNPSGNDITEAGGAPVAGDFQIRDTNPRYFNIPMVRMGWRNVTIGFYMPTAFDQTMDLRVYGVPTGSWSNLWALLMQTSVGTANYVFAVDSSVSDGAVGEMIMGDPVLSSRVAHIPALTVYPSFTIRISFSVAPTVGEFQLYVTRST